MERFRMELESLSQNEEFARVVVAVFMSRLNPTLEEVDDVKTAVSEAVTNAVIHGYKGGEGIILLEAEIDGQELTVRVRDRGMGIADVEKAREPMYTTRTLRNGIFFYGGIYGSCFCGVRGGNRNAGSNEKENRQVRPWKN